MIVRILVDTNVILYVRDGRFPDKQARCAAWLRAASRSAAMVVSPQVAGEHQLNAQRKLRVQRADAQLATRQLMAYCARGTEPEDVLRALDIETRWNVAWWDAMHIAYAIGAGCTHFLTEDAQSAPTIDGLRIIDPFRASPEEILGAA